MISFLKAHIYPGALHHAYCISDSTVSDHVAGTPHASFFAFLEKHLNIPTRGNPDFWHGQFESLGIDEARQIKEMQLRSAANAGAKKIFVISTGTITHEAQNALLKVFEEPTADTHFFLLMPSAEVLLPTLRSRVVIVSIGEMGVVPGSEQLAKSFLGASKGKRMAIVKSLIEEKDKSATLALVDGLLKALSKNPKETLVHQKELQELLAMRGYLNDRSSSLKMILEYLCLVVK